MTTLGPGTEVVCVNKIADNNYHGHPRKQSPPQIGKKYIVEYVEICQKNSLVFIEITDLCDCCGLRCGFFPKDFRVIDETDAEIQRLVDIVRSPDNPDLDLTPVKTSEFACVQRG